MCSFCTPCPHINTLGAVGLSPHDCRHGRTHCRMCRPTQRTCTVFTCVRRPPTPPPAPGTTMPHPSTRHLSSIGFARTPNQIELCSGGRALGHAKQMGRINSKERSLVDTAFETRACAPAHRDDEGVVGDLEAGLREAGVRGEAAHQLLPHRVNVLAQRLVVLALR